MAETAQVWANFSNPVVVLSTLIVVSTIATIGAAILGIDKGVLPAMAKTEYARGLICYLFAIVTIGVALAIMLYALVGPFTGANDLRMQQGKDVLSLLLGVFGTMVGFYFGSDTGKNAVDEEDLNITSLDLNPRPVAADGMITVRAVIRGGKAPYKFGIGRGSAVPELNELAGEGGWVTKQLQLQAGPPGTNPFVKLLVQDANGKRAEQVATATIAP